MRIVDKTGRTGKFGHGEVFPTGTMPWLEHGKAVRTGVIGHFAASHPRAPRWTEDMKASALQPTSRADLSHASDHQAIGWWEDYFASIHRATSRDILAKASGHPPTEHFLQKRGTVHE